MAISSQRLTIYLYSAHRAVIFAIAQLSYSCNSTKLLNTPTSYEPWWGTSGCWKPPSCWPVALSLGATYSTVRHTFLRAATTMLRLSWRELPCGHQWRSYIRTSLVRNLSICSSHFSHPRPTSRHLTASKCELLLLLTIKYTVPMASTIIIIIIFILR